MTTREFYDALVTASTVKDVSEALRAFELSHSGEERWVPVGARDNNRGAIEASADPGRSLVERLTNGIDAVLEAEHNSHDGLPLCRSPKEAAAAWLNVAEGGLSEMTAAQRRSLALRAAVILRDGDGKDGRLVEVRDNGIGLTPDQMPTTILSLNESNKMQKHYLAGTYGQGGSSTYAVSKYTLIASRCNGYPTVGFTLVCFLDLPPEQFKTGHYVYLTLNGSVLQMELPLEEFATGTVVKHFGYDLSNYASPIGPNSVYGLLNQILFDPVMPVWLDNQVHGYRRVIKGSRNALNGAVDDGDENRRGPPLSHNVRMFHISLGDYGRIGIEYWVLERPSKENKNPIAAFVNPSRPIVLTLHGQNHAELGRTLVKKDAELPYLTQRLICHVDCNSLTPYAKRVLFVSNREEVRRGAVYNLIEQEVVRALRSDDELVRLNNEAREHSLRERDETAVQEMQREVARLLRIYGINLAEAVGSEAGGQEAGQVRPTRPHPPRPPPVPIELHDPPTYIRFRWSDGEPIRFHPEQRRFIRVETDANSLYHNPNNPTASQVNIILSCAGVKLCGSTPLQGGRMRAICEASSTARVGDVGTIRIELTRPGLSTLSDERPISIVQQPLVRPAARQTSLPPFEIRPVEGPNVEQWNVLGWPENVNSVASSAVMESGTLIIYYSTVYPKYASQFMSFEGRDPALANSFRKRYEIWLATHSLLYYQDQQTASAEAAQRGQPEENDDLAEARERQERCRIATLATLFGAREVQIPGALTETD